MNRNSINPSRETLLAAMAGDFRISTICRLLAGDDGNHPITIVSGDKAPKLAGDGFYWTTPGGTVINHPNAYKWPKVYHPSTLAVEVGIEWVLRILRRDGGAFRRDERHGVTTAVLTGSRQTIHGCRADAGRTTTGRKVWIVVLGNGSSFHATRRCALFAGRAELRADARRAVREAVHGLRKQRLADRKWQCGLGKPLDAIWVDEATSVAAGNCRSGTETQAARVRRAIGDVYAVRGDVLLAMRDDQFTRRAVAVASRSH